MHNDGKRTAVCLDEAYTDLPWVRALHFKHQKSCTGRHLHRRMVQLSPCKHPFQIWRDSWIDMQHCASNLAEQGSYIAQWWSSLAPRPRPKNRKRVRSQFFWTGLENEASGRESCKWTDGSVTLLLSSALSSCECSHNLTFSENWQLKSFRNPDILIEHCTVDLDNCNPSFNQPATHILIVKKWNVICNTNKLLHEIILKWFIVHISIILHWRITPINVCVFRSVV